MAGQKMGFISSLSQAGDRNVLEANAQLDALARGSTDEWIGGENVRSGAATAADTAERQRREEYTDYLHTLEGDETNRAEGRMKNAFALDEQDRNRRNDLFKEAQGASGEEFSQQDYLKNLAGGASGEQQTREDAHMKNLLSVAAARAGIDWNHVQAAGGAMSDAEWNAIELELKKAGIDAATLSAMRNDALKAGSDIKKAAS